MFYSLRILLWNPEQGRFLDYVCLTVFFPFQNLSQFIITCLFLFNICCSIASEIYAWFCFYLGPSLEHIICVCVCQSLSCIRLFLTPWVVVHQALLSMEFSRQEYWSGLPFPSPGDLLNPVIEPGSPALQADTSEPPGKPSWHFVLEYCLEHSRHASHSFIIHSFNKYLNMEF